MALTLSAQTAVAPGTACTRTFNVKPNSTYTLEVKMRTASGSDAVTLETSGLGAHDISIPTAKATWTRFSQQLNVADADNLTIRIVAGKGNRYDAEFDSLSIRRTGDYAAPSGNSPRRREVKTHLGITMQPDEKIQWMRDARIGMFIHWGLYAGPGRGEWYMENSGVPVKEYERLAYPESGDWYFTAKDFNADSLAALAKDMGARYMCLTTQHHDGYALFDSKSASAFTSMQTHGCDFVKEYVEAARRAGLKVGLYKTLINWRYPGYFDPYGTDCAPNRFGHQTEAWHRYNAQQMKAELYLQTYELMSNYGKIDHLFWDGGWLQQRGTDEDAAPFWESGKLMEMVRELQPDIVCNPRSGWIGDFTCEEGGGSVKGDVRSGVVEKCMTLGGPWGWCAMHEDSTAILSLQAVKRMCADCMVRGMCFLLNVGPDRHGKVPQAVQKRLREFGRWADEHAEAIYGTEGGPWNPVDGQYGFTRKGNKVYVYFLGEYDKDHFTLPPFEGGKKARRAYMVGSGRKIATQQKDGSFTLRNIPVEKGDISIVAVEYKD